MKGQTAQPISWILVIVAGIIFLLFFVAIIRVILNNNEERTNTITTTQLKRYVETSQGTPKLLTKTYLPEFDVSCNQDYEITYKSNTLSFKQAIFSPKKISGETTIWSEELLFPYPTITLTYIVPKNTLIIFDTNTQNLQELFSNNITTKVSSDYHTENLKGYTNVIIVVADDIEQKTVKKEPNQNIYGIFINNNDLTFYDYNNKFVKIGTSKYYQDELLIGAIVSNKEIYDCSLAKVDYKINLLAEIQKGRIENITNELEEQHRCYGYYDTAIFDDLTNNKISSDNNNNMLDARTNIKRKNNLLIAQSCPVIY